MCILSGDTESKKFKHIWKKYSRKVGVFHTLYNVQLSDKHENALKEICWNDAYLILGVEYQYMGNYNNNATHISNVEMHVGMVDMHTLYTWPF